MIKLRRLNGKEFVLNAELIETIEKTPDTVITLINEHKYVVEDDVDEVIGKVIEYKQKLGKM
ncbi:MAG: flagellar FlbD family protein [Synergistetes bacterium]|nr:flagellar FlbD family protein [Synergistota bacterium]